MNDARAFLLRKFFVFLIVPMLNPDGVYRGHYRKDIFNQNLNRFYELAAHEKQPSIYAVKSLVEYLNKDKRLWFYLDLHAHSGIIISITNKIRKKRSFRIWKCL